MSQWIAQAVYGLLTDDVQLMSLVPDCATLGGVPSIYLDKAPLKATTPYIVMTITGGTTRNALDPTADIETAIIEFQCVDQSSNAASVSAIEDRLRQILRYETPNYPSTKRHVAAIRIGSTGPVKGVPEPIWEYSTTYRFAYQNLDAPSTSMATGTPGWTVTWPLNGNKNVTQQVTVSLQCTGAPLDTTNTGDGGFESNIFGVTKWGGKLSCNLDETTPLSLPGVYANILLVSPKSRQFSGKAGMVGWDLSVDPDRDVVIADITFIGNGVLSIG
jgi:hypothetical protein